MQDTEAVLLKGGRSNQEVVRIEETVHRPVGEHSQFVHSLLTLLEEKGFKYSPRFLGIDEQGREILSFIDGVVPHGDINLTEENIIQGAKVLRQFHDATAGSELAGESEVVCHNDFAPWNIVVDGDAVVGIIDFDNATKGERLDDFAYFIWTSINLGQDLDSTTQGRKMRMLCEIYGLSDRSGLVDAVLKQQEKILEKRKHLAENDVTEEAKDYSKSKVTQIEKEIEWVRNHMVDLEKQL
jgi:hypothetical protein